MLLEEWICGDCRIVVATVSHGSTADDEAVLKEIFADVQSGGIDLSAPARYFYKACICDLERFDARMTMLQETIHPDSDYSAEVSGDDCTCEHGTFMVVTQQLEVSRLVPDGPGESSSVAAKART